MTRPNVVLPQPLSPTSPSVSPFLMSNVTPFAARAALARVPGHRREYGGRSVHAASAEGRPRQVPQVHRTHHAQTSGLRSLPGQLRQHHLLGAYRRLSNRVRRHGGIPAVAQVQNDALAAVRLSRGDGRDGIEGSSLVRDLIDDRLAVDGIGEGLAHARIVQRRLGAVVGNECPAGAGSAAGGLCPRNIGPCDRVKSR